MMCEPMVDENVVSELVNYNLSYIHNIIVDCVHETTQRGKHTHRRKGRGGKIYDEPFDEMDFKDILQAFPEVVDIYLEKVLFNDAVHTKLVEHVDFEPFLTLAHANKDLEQYAIVNMCKKYLFAAKWMYRFCNDRYIRLILVKMKISKIAECDTQEQTEALWRDITMSIKNISEEVTSLILSWTKESEETANDTVTTIHGMVISVREREDGNDSDEEGQDSRGE